MIWFIIAGVLLVLIAILDLMFDILGKYENFCEKHSNRPTLIGVIVDFLFPSLTMSNGTRRDRFISAEIQDWILFIIGLIFLSAAVFL